MFKIRERLVKWLVEPELEREMNETEDLIKLFDKKTKAMLDEAYKEKVRMADVQQIEIDRKKEYLFIFENMTPEQIDRVSEIFKIKGWQGIVVTNTKPDVVIKK
ncbi:unnamed protein product [marine sediment metagenome]|uniref:Uncharacterized protein n=1 Tax=marine sediment metagenome TaxID=412755 RepID=X1S280_9ZZZZ